MKKVRKLILLAGVQSILAIGLAACGRAECDFCYKSKKCGEYGVGGEIFTMCDDCYSEWISGVPLTLLFQ